MSSVFGRLQHIRPLVAIFPFMGLQDNRARFSFMPHIDPISDWNFDPERQISDSNTHFWNQDLKNREVVSHLNDAGFKNVRERWFLGIFPLRIPLFFGSLLCDENQDRMVSLPELRRNPKMQDLTSLGLQEVGGGWYQLNKKNPMHVRIEDGQLMWKAGAVMNNVHIKEIADFYKEKLPNRSIHINTGIHADESGQPAWGNKSGIFPVEDIIAFDGYTYVSYHIVSPERPHISHRERPYIDIVNAWCFSKNTPEYREFGSAAEWEKAAAKIVDQSEISLLEILKQFIDVEKLGYPSKIYPETSYVEFPGLEDAIRNQLNLHGFCYVQGIGGLGKSRVAYETEQRIRKSPKEMSQYSDTIFVSRKSDALKEDFFKHVQGCVGKVGSEDILTEKYFEQVAGMARVRGQKVFVVVDNIDTDEDLRFLETLYRGLVSSHSERFRNFHLVVTGRLDLSKFMNQRGLTGKVVEIQNYCTEDHAWELFEENFSKNCDPDFKQDGLECIRRNKSKLIGLFKKYKFHTGFTLVLGKSFAESFTLAHTIDPYLEDLERHFDQIIEMPGLNDYEQLSLMTDAPLRLLDQKWGGKASEVFHVLALISDGEVRYPFLQKVVEYYQQPPMGVLNFNSLLTALIKYGLVVHSPKERILVLPDFYHEICRTNLAKKIESESPELDIDRLFHAVFRVIRENVEKSETDRPNINQDLMHILSLFNFARRLPTLGSRYEGLNEKIAEYATERLQQIQYEHFIGIYTYFLSRLVEVPGYTLDPVLSTHLKGQRIATLVQRVPHFINTKNASNFNDKANAEERNMTNLRLLNNMYVLAPESDPDFKEIEAKLKKYLYGMAPEDSEPRSWTKIFSVRSVRSSISDKVPLEVRTAYENLKKGKRQQEKLTLFPQIGFHKILDEKRKAAEDWKRKHSLQDKTEFANLSKTYLEDGLRVLIHYLLVEREIEDIDLSNNYLGSSARLEAIDALAQLLKYPGSMKTLRLNNNSLNRIDRFSKICDGIKDNTTLEVLILNNNSLTDKEIEKLCSALEKHPKIKHIELHSNRIQDKGMAFLEDLMKKNENILYITTQSAHWYTEYHDGTTRIVRGPGGQPQRRYD